MRRADQGTAASVWHGRQRPPRRRQGAGALIATAASAALVLTLAVPAGASAAGSDLSRPSSLQPAAASSNDSAVTGRASRVIVKYKADARGSARVRALSTKGLRVRRTLALTGAKLVDVPAGRTTAAVVAELRQDPSVEYAVPDVLRKPLADAPAPNDPHFGQQWGLRNTGQPLAGSSGAGVPTSGVDVDALGAWGVRAGSPAVTVAVIDQGVAITHPDLRGAVDQRRGDRRQRGRRRRERLRRRRPRVGLRARVGGGRLDAGRR